MYVEIESQSSSADMKKQRDMLNNLSPKIKRSEGGSRRISFTLLSGNISCYSYNFLILSLPKHAPCLCSTTGATVKNTHREIIYRQHVTRTSLFPETNVITAGDSPRGPLKQRGNPHLNPGIETR
jgi:hypothetical protein